jgi:hypothetical protein
MQIALGNQRNWETTDLINVPAIEIRPAAEINNARGAFAAATNTIYLSQELVNENTGNVGAIASVLLEEYGHYLDAQNNAIDSPGDEGELFADLVLGKGLSQSELLALWGEDDSAIVVWDGEGVSIEQKTQSDTLNFFAEEIDFDSFDGDINFFKETYALPKETIDSSGIKFTRELNATLVGKAYAKADTGKLKFSYPITVDVEGLPENAKPNETITLKLNTENFLALGSNGSFTGSEGLELDAGIKFGLEPGKFSFKDIEVKNPFNPSNPFKLDGFDLGGSLGKAELNYNLSTLAALLYSKTLSLILKLSKLQCQSRKRENRSKPMKEH